MKILVKLFDSVNAALIPSVLMVLAYSTLTIKFPSIALVQTSSAQTGNVLLDEEVLIPDLKPTDVIIWDVSTGVQYSDGYISVPLQLKTKQNFSIYTDKLNFLPPAGTKIHSVNFPNSSTLLDPVTKKMVDVYSGGYFEIILKLEKKAVKNEIDIAISYLGCTSKICLFPFTETKSIGIFAKNEAYQYNSNDDAKLTSDAITSNTEQDIQEVLAKRLSKADLPLYLIAIICFFGGILTNLTPCVYPMIPITIKVLSRQGSSPVLSSSAYSLGILLTYTAMGIFAVLTGSLFGSIMASKSFNLIIGLIMLLMAISMLGFGNFTALQNLGNKIGAGKASLKNAFLMGTGAGLVASPCTGPVLATLLSYSATQSNQITGILLLSIYSLGFALPYIILGSTAATITKVKLSPKLQVMTKLIFSSVIFALALYYFRIPFYDLLNSLNPDYNTIATSMITLGLIMIFVMAVAERMYSQKFYLVGPMIALGLGLFAFSQTSNLTTSTEKIAWIKSEKTALSIAAEKNLPVMIDAWAEWCVACKKMDVTTFVDPEVVSIISERKIIPLKLDLTEINDETDKLQKKYNIVGLPTVILLEKGGDLSSMKILSGLQTPATLIPALKKLK